MAGSAWRGSVGAAKCPPGTWGDPSRSKGQAGISGLHMDSGLHLTEVSQAPGANYRGRHCVKRGLFDGRT